MAFRRPTVRSRSAPRNHSAFVIPGLKRLAAQSFQVHEAEVARRVPPTRASVARPPPPPASRSPRWSCCSTPARALWPPRARSRRDRSRGSNAGPASRVRWRPEPSPCKCAGPTLATQSRQWSNIRTSAPPRSPARRRRCGCSTYGTYSVRCRRGSSNQGSRAACPVIEIPKPRASPPRSPACFGPAA